MLYVVSDGKITSLSSLHFTFISICILMLMDTWGFPIVWILSITLMNIGVRTYLLGTDFISIGLYAGFAFVLFRKHRVLLEKVTFCLGIPV